jgi:uncharacterized membrane protein
MWGQPPKLALSAVEEPALSLSKGAVRVERSSVRLVSTAKLNHHWPGAPFLARSLREKWGFPQTRDIGGCRQDYNSARSKNRDPGLAQLLSFRGEAEKPASLYAEPNLTFFRRTPVSPHSIVFLVSLVIVILLLVLVDRLLRPSLRGLLEDVTGLPAATEFYLRAFLLVIIFVALATVLAAGHADLKDGAHFMEYVWSVASGLQDMFSNLLIVLLVYVGLITVLMAALRRKH